MSDTEHKPSLGFMGGNGPWMGLLASSGLYTEAELAAGLAAAGVPGSVPKQGDTTASEPEGPPSDPKED